MIDPGSVVEHLVGSGLVRAEQFEEAQRCVSVRKVSLDEALIILNMVQYTDLGRCYSDICQLPYVPILTRKPPDEARRLCSMDCATAWRVFPLAYDAETNLLTLVIHNPEQIQLMERINRFFMQPHTLAFTIASEAEIKEALQPDAAPMAVAAAPAPGSTARADEDKQAGAPAPTGTADAEKKKAPAFDRGKAAQTAQKTAGQPMWIGAGRKSQQKDKVEPLAGTPDLSYVDMGRALVGTAAVAARAFLSSDPVRLQEIGARVRHCELLCSRLNMSPIQTDATLMAAWLSAFEDRREMIRQLVTPYKIEEILFPADGPRGADRVEGRILGLVKCYQQLRATSPDDLKDVNLTRRLLHKHWSSAPARQRMLETFLQVLMDEQFLSKLDRKVGRILIVDPAEGSRAILTPPLLDRGYEVHSAPGAEGAEEALLKFTPDIIISERDLPQKSGIEFCRQVKDDSKTASIPFIMLSRQKGDSHAAEGLRAGADEYILKPVDLELLFLKIQRLMPVVAEDETKKGVSGLLREMSFTDMIQILCAGGKSTELTFVRGSEAGHVFIQKGEIVHADVGETRGQDAFFALMRWSDGEFTMKQCTDFPERTIEISAMSLLMEGARLVDEAKELDKPADETAAAAQPASDPKEQDNPPAG